LCGHVARVLGLTVGVDCVLSAADELPLVFLDELGLVESQPDGPRMGVDWRALSHGFSFRIVDCLCGLGGRSGLRPLGRLGRLPARGEAYAGDCARE
jgi:hypothetical protein